MKVPVMKFPPSTSQVSGSDAAPNPPVPDSLGRGMAALVGFFVCGFAAAVVGEALSLVVLIPPLSHWTHFDGEFDPLILIGMPPMAGGCGALAGISLGILFRQRKRRMIASCVGALPALLLYSQSYDSHLTDGWENSPIPAFVVSLIILLAAVTAVVIADRVLRSIEQRRARVSSREEVTEPVSQARVTTGIVLVLSVVGLLCNASLWRVLNQEGNSGSGFEFPLLGSCLVSLLTIAASVYLLAAHPRRRLTAIACGLTSLIGFLVVLATWYVRVLL